MNNFNFQLIPQPMWLYDVNSLRFLEVNEAAIIHYGYSREEFMGMTLKDIRRPEDLPLFEETITAIKAGQLSIKGRFKHLKKNGEVIDVEVKGSILENRSGLTGFAAVNDITELLENQRLAQISKEELLHSEKRFKSLVQEGSDLIAILDAEGKYSFISANFKTILGYEPAALLDNICFDYIHPNDREKLLKVLHEIVNVKHYTVTDPYRFKNSKNEWRWLLTTITNLLHDPAVKGIVTNSKDITDNVEKTNELNLSNERYKLVIKAADEAICDWDILNDTADWGATFQEIFGYDLSKPHPNLWLDNIHPDDKPWVTKAVEDAINDPSKELVASEYRFYKANREIAVVQYRGVFLRNEAGVAIRLIGSFRDITAYKNSMYELQRRNEQLEEIAWTQSHKVRAALCRIIGLVDLLEAEEFTTETQKELLKHLSISAANLDEVVKSIVNRTATLP